MRTRRKKEIVELYGYYFNDIGNIWRCLILERKELTVKNIQITSGRLQAAYKEIKESGFKGTLVDYLSIIDIRFWLWTSAHGQAYEGSHIPFTFPLVMWNLEWIFNAPEFEAYSKANNLEKDKAEQLFISQMTQMMGNGIISWWKGKQKRNKRLARG